MIPKQNFKLHLERGMQRMLLKNFQNFISMQCTNRCHLAILAFSDCQDIIDARWPLLVNWMKSWSSLALCIYDSSMGEPLYPQPHLQLRLLGWFGRRPPSGSARIFSCASFLVLDQVLQRWPWGQKTPLSVCPWGWRRRSSCWWSTSGYWSFLKGICQNWASGM